MTFNYAEEEVVHGHESEELDLLEPHRSEESILRVKLGQMFEIAH